MSNYQHKLARKRLQNVAVVKTHLDSQPFFVNLKTLSKIRMLPKDTTNYAQYLMHAHPFRTYCSVMCVNSHGEQYILSDDVSRRDQFDQLAFVRHADIAPILHEKHVNTMNRAKRFDRVNVGWISIPSGKELTEREIDAILRLSPTCFTAYERGGCVTEKEFLEYQIRKLESEK